MRIFCEYSQGKNTVRFSENQGPGLSWALTKGGELDNKNKTIPEDVQTLDLLDKEFKYTVLYILKKLRETMNKELRKP